MRLHKVYTICKKNQEVSNKLSEENLKRDSKYIEIQNFGFIEEALDEIGTIPFLKKYVENVNSIFIGDKKNIVTDEQMIKFKVMLDDLDIRLNSIIQLCEYFEFGMDKTGFDLKLPSVNDFSSIAECVTDFNFILNQFPAFNLEGAKIQFEKVDMGSTWIEFVVTGVSAISLLNLVADFVNTCVKIWHDILVCKELEKNSKKLGLEEEVIQTMVQAHKKLIDMEMNNYAKNSGINKKYTPEDYDRAALCFDKMVRLLDKGIEIHSSIADNKQDKQVQFPKADDWERISNQILRLISAKDN